MNRRILILAAAVTVAIVSVSLLIRQLSTLPITEAAHAEIAEALNDSLEDQRRLAELDPELRDHYRDRFEDIEGLRTRLAVLALTGTTLTRRIETVLIISIAAILLFGSILYVIEIRSREARLRKLHSTIEALTIGEEPIRTHDRRGDVIGRINRMIESTSAMVGRTRRRVRYLEHLSTWQESARRHAHEIRTPLAAARVEVSRLASLVSPNAEPEIRPQVEHARDSVLEELALLQDFMERFFSFATIRQPRPRTADLGRFLREFIEHFAPMWPDLDITMDNPTEPHESTFDPDMLRQVLTNLIGNSARALDGAGIVSIRVGRSEQMTTVTVTDNGPGIPPHLGERIFEPYVTTSASGEGMGLGLSIAKKIMLDHGGDLELEQPEGPGATFILSLPRNRKDD